MCETCAYGDNLLSGYEDLVHHHAHLLCDAGVGDISYKNTMYKKDTEFEKSQRS